jgi:hypothetical protein
MRSFERSVHPLVALIALWLTLLASRGHAQQGSAVLVGTITDAASSAPIADAVVTVTSPSLQGEELAVTDATGAYRIPGLPPGLYVLRIDRDGYRPYAREALDLHADLTIRLNGSLLPDSLKAEEVVVVGRTPTVDIGSSATGMNITSEFTQRIPLAPPGGRDSASRSFESVADVVPGAQLDAFGVSMFGASSPENRYLLDGLSVNNPVYGLLGTPLSIDFLKEVSVLSGGYMPEYGRSTGGILNAITKSGSNEFHGSLFTNWSPGALEGQRKRVQRQGETIVTEPQLHYLGDIGADLGGPIVRDRLWFYVGFDWAQTRYKLHRSLYRTLLDNTGQPYLDENGDPARAPIPGSRQTYEAQQDLYQAIGKLTWAVNGKNRLTLTLNGVYPKSGGDGKYGINPLTGLPEIGTENTGYTSALVGPYSALAHRYLGSSTNAILKWSTELDGKRSFVDTMVGYHHATGGRLPADGSAIGSARGFAGMSNVWWLRNTPPHSILDFEPNAAPGGACDAPAGVPDAVPCPVLDYHTGGPDFINEQVMDRLQARSVYTYLFQGLGHHVFKAGFDLEFIAYDHLKAYAGKRSLIEADDGSYFQDGRVYGYLTGPDQVVELASVRNRTRSVSLGGFVQDSWNVADLVTLNLGLRYDAQLMYAGDGTLALALPSQWSPRAGIVWDPTYEGRAKLFTNFARYYETVPVLMLDRYLTGEPLVYAHRDSEVCNPLEPNNACLTPGALLPWGAAPNQNYRVASAGRTPVDPDIKAPSSDEFVVGGDYEIVRDGRLALSYTKRWLNHTIEDMSRDEAQTYFFGNPGYGIARDFPKARRRYDAVMLQFMKSFSQTWLAQASYTLSFFRGNYTGLFRPEDQQLDPHQNSDFDLRSLSTNRYGYLPGDRRHAVKAFLARDIALGKFEELTVGLAFRAFSGEPSNYLGGHPLYGVDQVYILPRGAGERLPWTYSSDLRIAYGLRFAKERRISATVDIFNLFNFQRATLRDQRYTSSPVAPVESGGLGALRSADGGDFDAASVNPNFGRATRYQPPRVVRFGLRGTF